MQRRLQLLNAAALSAMLASGTANAAPLVAIDVGHSISAPGAISARGKPEFEFNQGMARIVQQTLTRDRVPSILIGSDGNEVDLLPRTIAAEDAGATFLVSIHHDSVQPQYLETWNTQGMQRQFSDRFSGFSLFVSHKNPAAEASLSCARAIGFALEQAGLHPSHHHAENIPGENRAWADKDAGVYYYDDLVVLKSAKIPAVLIEAGVIVNRQEEQTIRQTQVRKVIANAIARGLSDCGAI